MKKHQDLADQFDNKVITDLCLFGCFLKKPHLACATTTLPKSAGWQDISIHLDVR